MFNNVNIYFIYIKSLRLWSLIQESDIDFGLIFLLISVHLGAFGSRKTCVTNNESKR